MTPGNVFLVFMNAKTERQLHNSGPYPSSKNSSLPRPESSHFRLRTFKISLDYSVVTRYLFYVVTTDYIQSVRLGDFYSLQNQKKKKKPTSF